MRTGLVSEQQKVKQKFNGSLSGLVAVDAFSTARSKILNTNFRSGFKTKTFKFDFAPDLVFEKKKLNPLLIRLEKEP